MILNIQDDILKIHALGLLDKLLQDKTTARRIMWATDAYSALGAQYGRNEEITPELMTGSNADVIKTRARKEMEQQSSRTRQHGEVSTPLWVCQKMCDYFDEIWDRKAGWQKYVDAKVLEITCGEAPFLVSRYDAETGEVIPVLERIGLLDRKLRTVNENTQTEGDWLKWAFRAFRATYGYEFQGDNLLISRVNLLMTFEEYLLNRWKRKPTLSEYGRLITVIVWNIWQMDGLRGTIPYGTATEESLEIDWFGWFDRVEEEHQPRCRVYNWTGGGSVEFLALPIRGKRTMKFDFIIGNPPYQEETEGTSDKPIYNLFMDAAYGVSDRVLLVTPARFLFNAGKTPKLWNQKMLNDPHIKVMYYEQDSSKVFANTDIKGGIAITYRETNTNFGPIDVFLSIDELRSIFEKMRTFKYESFSTLIYAPESYRFTEVMHRELPDVRAKLSFGHAFDLTTNIFEKLEDIVFFKKCPNDGEKYVRIYGKKGNERMYMWILEKYIGKHENLDSYKVILPKSNGSGAIGEVLSTPLVGSPLVGSPLVGHTQTFLSIGAFETEFEAEACLKYVKSRFARTLLGILKITQDNKKGVWKYVPIQDFTPTSDIDWSKSIPEIDQQLYAKYGLTEEEIQFIETHVKEMT